MPLPHDVDAEFVVARDHVGGGKTGSAKMVARCIADEHAVTVVAQAKHRVRVDSDVVTLKHVACGAIVQGDAVVSVARDDVDRQIVTEAALRRSADHVAGAPLITTPSNRLPSGVPPVTSVPMKLPSTTLPAAVSPSIVMPMASFPEMIFRPTFWKNRLSAVPPIWLPGAIDEDPVETVAEIMQAKIVCSNVIALHGIPTSLNAKNTHTVRVVSRNQVPRQVLAETAKLCPAHGIPWGVNDRHAVERVADIRFAQGVGADGVPLHKVPC